MANDEQRLADLERRLQALEGGQQGAAQTTGPGQQEGQTPTPQDAAAIQAFFTGALIASAIQQGGGAQTGGQDQGAAPMFLSIFGCGGGGGWSPTKYDSFFWCKSRFACNPQSLSCLC